MLYEYSEASKPKSLVGLPEKQWYKYAALVNVKAAFVFREIAEEVLVLDTDTDNPFLPIDPLVYLVRSHARIIQRWQKTVSDFVKIETPTESTLVSCKVTLTSLEMVLVSLNAKLKSLKEDLAKDNEFRDQGDLPAADPFPAHRAAVKLEDKLSWVTLYLKDAQTNMEKKLHSDSRSRFDTETGAESQLRKRKPIIKKIPKAPSADSTNSMSSDVTKTRNSGLFNLTKSWLINLGGKILEVTSSGAALPSLSFRAPLVFCLRQSTVQSLTFLAAILGALMIGFSVMQTRPSECETQAGSFDDGFWALLSQLFTQAMSLYCTIIPILRDRDMMMPASWFWASTGISLVTSVLAPILYALGISWRATALVNYASGATALLASLLLAKGVERVFLRNNLGHYLAGPQQLDQSWRANDCSPDHDFVEASRK
ncbi:hypothetical protein MMC10_005544 [Thelotrema lepadinum]|nr:hypothetical protein [Thelotrema lepadinum]